MAIIIDLAEELVIVEVGVEFVIDADPTTFKAKTKFHRGWYHLP